MSSRSPSWDWLSSPKTEWNSLTSPWETSAICSTCSSTTRRPSLRYMRHSSRTGPPSSPAVKTLTAGSIMGCSPIKRDRSHYATVRFLTNLGRSSQITITVEREFTELIRLITIQILTCSITLSSTTRITAVLWWMQFNQIHYLLLEAIKTVLKMETARCKNSAVSETVLWEPVPREVTISTLPTRLITLLTILQWDSRTLGKMLFDAYIYMLYIFIHKW